MSPLPGRKEVMRVLSSLLTAALIFVMGACATTSTRITDSWVNPEVKAPLAFEKVFVLLVSKNHDMRVQVEGAIAALLQQRGLTGIPANMSIPDEVLKDREKVKEQLGQIHVDGVIVMRYQGTTERTQYVSTSPAFWGAYPSFWGYYNYAWPSVWDSGYYVTDTFVKVETRIYDLRTDTLIWGGMSQTWNPSDPQASAKELAQTVGAAMRKDGLIK